MPNVLQVKTATMERATGLAIILTARPCLSHTNLDAQSLPQDMTLSMQTV